MLGVPLAVPMLAGLFIKRVPGWAAIFSAMCGFFPALLDWSFGWGWNYQTKVFSNLSVGLTAFLLTIPLWRTTTEAYRQQVTDFYKRMTTPVDFEKEIGQANDLTQLTMIGAFTCAVSSFIFLLLFLPNEWHGRLAITAVGGVVMAIGATMIVIGKRGARDRTGGGLDGEISDQQEEALKKGD
jgi:solute:Na+ symporter, SSS family